MKPRLSPSLAVAVLALVVAVGGTGYAAGLVTSAQIKDGTIKSKDVKDRALKGVDVKDGSLAGADVADGALTGADVADGSLGRAELNRACAAGEAAAFGGCVRLAPFGPTTYFSAVADCSQRGGRLPILGELKWIADHDEYTWANGAGNQYEHSGTFTSSQPYTPMGFDRSFTASFTNTTPQSFYYHCITY